MVAQVGFPLFVYDDAFKSYAGWAARRMRSGSVVLASEAQAEPLLGGRLGDCSGSEALLWLEPDSAFGGHEAIARSLVDMGSPWKQVGRAMMVPGLDGVVGLLYRLGGFERRRNPLLGATPHLASLNEHDAHSDSIDTALPRKETTGLARLKSLIGINETPPADTALTILLLIAVMFVGRFVRKLAHPGAATFTHSTVILGMLAERSRALVPLALSVIAFVFRRNVRWTDIFDGRRLRPFVMTAAATLVITSAFYEPNYFFGQMHIIDRVLAVVLFATIWVRPVTVLPFAVFVVTTGAQFDYPAGGYTWTHKRPVVFILLLFGILVVVGGARTLRAIQSYFAATCVMFIIWYLAAGAGKVSIGWIGLENLTNLAASAHANGWLPVGIAKGQVQAVRQMNTFLVLLTIVVESASILLLAGRRLAVFVLPWLTVVHFAIFAMTGINFISTWTIVEVALGIYILRGGAGVARARPVLIAFVLVITFLGPYLYSTFRLVWLDTPYTVSYELEAVGRSGTQYRVDRGTMAPYDFAFVHNYFSFVSDVPVVSIHGFGGTMSPDVARALKAARNLGDLAAVEERFGRSYFNPERAAAFDELVRARFHRPAESLPIHPTHEYWNGPPPIVDGSSARALYRRQEPITWVNVRLIKTWWDGRESHVLASCVVREIEVAGPQIRRPDPTACRIPT